MQFSTTVSEGSEVSFRAIFSLCLKASDFVPLFKIGCNCSSFLYKGIVSKISSLLMKSCCKKLTRKDQMDVSIVQLQLSRMES